jgi:protein AIR1/2
MTSTAVFEIIDLTDTRTPSEDETQNISKTAECSTDPDPEKSATRAARKRKNGEAGRTRGHPVKSRDGSLERGHAQSGEDTKPQLAEDAQESIREPTGKKKRRSKKNKNKDKDSGPPSREDTQQDALLTFDDGQLFLVDTEPAAVPEGMVFDPARDDNAAAPSSSSQTSGQDKVPLLLPKHVSVLDPGDDLPVQIIQPAESDSDSESYIEYLDYDDRLVRLPHSTPCYYESVAHFA